MINAEMSDGIALVTMNHGKVNAMDIEFCQTLNQQLDRLENDNECRAVIVTAPGRVFSAGVDLVRLLDEDVSYLDSFLPELIRLFESAFFFAKPLVAAINGHAIAGGFVLACACDYRIMVEKSGRVGVPELRVGVPFPSIAMEIMRHATPPQHFEPVVIGGSTFGSELGLQNGLIHEVVANDQLIANSKTVAGQLAAVPTDVYKITKEQTRLPARDLVTRGNELFGQRLIALWKSTEVRVEIQKYVKQRLNK